MSVKREHHCYSYVIRRQTGDQSVADEIAVSHATATEYAIHVRLFGQKAIDRSSVQATGAKELLSDEELGTILRARYNSVREINGVSARKAYEDIVATNVAQGKELTTTLSFVEKDEEPKATKAPAKKD